MRSVAPGWKRPYQLEVGRRLRELRTERGLSVPELAALVGMSRGTLGKLERGLHAPRPETVAALATALGVPASALTPR